MNAMQKNVILVCVIIMSVSFVLIQFVIGTKYQAVKTTQKTLEVDNALKKTRLENITQLKTPLNTLEVSMAQIDIAGLPTGNALPETIEQVEALMKTVDGFSVASFSPTLTTPTISSETATGSNTSDFTLAVTGDPAKLTNLFDAFANSIRPMYVKNIIISPIAGSTSINVALSMTTYSGDSGKTGTATEGASSTTTGGTQ